MSVREDPSSLPVETDSYPDGSQTLNPNPAASSLPPSQAEGLWFKAIEERALAEDFLHIDHELVPCRPLVELRGLSFLSATARDEYAKNLRPDVVR
ncbi:hypothetical protein, conserved [Eimeria maxima]|uniref:Uncharacterized protein n=1 Tax=Eimeria maxima TaxID=5804 RepID=U6LZ70_EIMMA|nr:hypothetical protein, conserved [Eimeria maxima]CDJ57262.1 hypothetical protein, conserved [Eimeria maxima]